MNTQTSRSILTFLKFMGYGLAALLLAQVTDKGLWAIDWCDTGRMMANFAVIGLLKGLMTWWATPEYK